MQSKNWYQINLVSRYNIGAFVSQVFTHIYQIYTRTPLYLQPLPGKRVEGVGPRNRSMERESPLYIRKQLEKLFTTIRKYSLGRRRNSLGY